MFSFLVDEIAELNSYRKPVKLGNGVHRNQSYYIAMNRSGQRGERHPSSGRSLAKSPFYQPLEEYSTVTEQNVEIARPFNDEKPKIVIASYTDAARVSTPARAFCISSRPTSTVAEPTPSMSTTGPTKSRGSSEAKVEKARDKKSSRQSDATRSKRPPATLPIPKGTPPPPPPRTSRPSPYAKQFPNYLPLNALALRKTDSNFSDSSDGSEISSVLQSPGGSTSEGKILSSAEEETKNGDKSNVLVAEAKIDSKIDDNSDHHADVSADNLTDDESAEEPFLREGFGRQSMSEKRFKLAQADITQTEFYKQRVTRSKSLEG